MSRKIFVHGSSFKGKLSLGGGQIRINRTSIYKDTVAMYSTKPRLVNQFPLSVHFDGEKGLDFGGVSRDLLSGFWEEAYSKMFDGAALLTPACHATVDMQQFAVLGKILSHTHIFSSAGFCFAWIVNQHYTGGFCGGFCGFCYQC